ncbi:MAG: phytoene desaturase [Pseudonocardiales bacterium]|nr:phytoene desaturase [Pseudonocardiales bacterium]MBV9029204.1 phytoene desaturase [Pseudonocardiales bacterium]MBW0009352.1 phytoene desaturase [Pseudonocardiales bacterium]
MRTVPGPTDHVVIVGAGLAGLSAALHLLGSGRQVTVLEAEPHPGGRAGRMDLAGYRLDTGPTVLTMPQLVEEALASVGDSLAARLDLVALHPAYRARFADGSVIDVHTDADAMEAQIRAVSGPAEAHGYRRLRHWLTRLYQVEIGRFIGGNFDSPLDLVAGRDAVRDLAALAALGGFGRLGAQVGRFVHDQRLQRIFSFQALYAGVPPQRALGAYAVIAYMDTVAGVWFPRGGIQALPQALADAAADAGADIRYNTTVTALEHSGERVTAVHTAERERVGADAVVLTPDLPVVHRLLGRAPRRLVPLRWSPSAVVLHAGVRAGTGPGWTRLAHHTISFGEAWERTFDEIIYRGQLMTDPSLLITRPTATDPSLAPEGRELLYILAPCPNLRTAPLDWATLGPAYRDELVSTLERRGLTDLGEAIELEQLVTPADWAAQGLAVGTPFSAAHTFAQTGPLRPSNLVRGLTNVVLAGCGTTPGVGVPTALISGKLAAARITAVGARRRTTMSG